MTTPTLSAPVLAEYIPGRRVRAVALVLTGTILLTIAGQVAVPLPFTPVPVSLATGAVVLIGAAMGPALGASSVLLYLVAGLAGAPLFADQASGWAFASFGYILGYIPAVVLAGMLARRRADRSVGRTILLTALASLAVYALGLPWLMAFLGVDLGTGLALGVTPFLIGDAVKMAAAAIVLPGAWKIAQRVRGEG
ncbi:MULTISPECIES: biotin transporter BioY [unclassified Pseudactinotalea]|uniref:biotin transporter BioY n=1 Tax=unclassified Pseudactinotalea TaxID=2649176 RepID=UPI00128E91FA|nr:MULTISPECIES: biotin transporter BioY [unclassified Pseudactinotalea]MPV49065.1 biotin transporter BioY [Pseudactinotalea sp. HY160]QGH68262.1 biotin transporter BioY [Pseudactinotalea sp. HY158]